MILRVLPYSSSDAGIAFAEEIFISSVLWGPTVFSLPGRPFGVETRGCGCPCFVLVCIEFRGHLGS